MTTYSIYGFDRDEGSGEKGIVWREPKILVDPASIYTTSDRAVWSAGDIITDGELIAIVAADPEGKMVRCPFKPRRRKSADGTVQGLAHLGGRTADLHEIALIRINIAAHRQSVSVHSRALFAYS